MTNHPPSPESFGRNESVVVLGNLNDSVANKVVEGIVGQHGVCHEEMRVANDYWSLLSRS